MIRSIKIQLFFVIFLLCMMSQMSAAEDIVRLTNGEWPPYFSEHLPNYGIGSRIVSEAFALEGITVEYGFFPWKRSLLLAQKGRWDGTVGWEISDERTRYFYASDRVWETPWVFFYLKNHSFDWETYDDLKHVSIGATLGYMYTPEFAEAERREKITVDRANSDALSWKKLLKGRIEIFPQLIESGVYQLQELNRETRDLITFHPKPLGKHNDYLFLSKKLPGNAELMKRFNRGLRRLKESGRYEELFEEFRIKYGDN